MMEAQPDTTSLTVDLIQDKLSQVTSVFQRLVDKASLDPTEKAQVQQTVQQLSVKRSTWPEHLRKKNTVLCTAIVQKHRNSH